MEIARSETRIIMNEQDVIEWIEYKFPKLKIKEIDEIEWYKKTLYIDAIEKKKEINGGKG